jgi:hypothetical protein
MTPRLVFTVDVEEDMPGWRIIDPIRVSNVAALTRLAELCAGLGVQPTYLCTYPVVTHPDSSAVLQGLGARGGCEIGTHMHPWNTPPFRGVPGRDGDERRHAYYPSELPAASFREKLDALHRAVTAVAGEEPRSYRAGRFGIHGAALVELVARGYEVDTSITPLAEHRADGGPDFRSAPEHPYRPAATDAARAGDLAIVEIPVSVGLTRRLPAALRRAYVRLPRWTRARGLLSRDLLGWIDYAWLYPVRFDLELMRRGADTLVAGGAPVLNVFLHSNELVPGQAGRVATAADVERVFADLAGILEHCLRSLGARPCTLRAAGRELRPTLGIAAR